MARLSIPYGRGCLPLELDEACIAAVLRPALIDGCPAAGHPVVAALRNPLSSPALADLARGKRRIVIITSDHTRALPSVVTLPLLLGEVRRGNPAAEITVLVGTGTHRASTAGELAAKFGKVVVRRERVVCHRGDDPNELVEIGRLPSGAPLVLNRLAAQADLLVAEGLIEPHFFAGFSGGPKSVLPGIAGHRAIRANHAGPNIGHPRARTAAVTGNPIRQEMEAAADLARLSFILNVVLGEGNRIAAAFAGDWRAVHARGTDLVAAQARVPAVRAPITIASNGGYPLDQNLYQAVKGMTTAEATTLPGGRIIIVAGCADGLGGEGFAALLAEMPSPAEFYARAVRTPPDETPPDLWQAQILARILRDHPVTLISRHIPPGVQLPPGLTVNDSLDRAVAEAMREAGPGARVTVIPDGVGVIPVVAAAHQEEKT